MILFVITLFGLFLRSQQFKSSSSGCKGTWVQNHHHITSTQTDNPDTPFNDYCSDASQKSELCECALECFKNRKGSEHTSWKNILLDKSLFSLYDK